MYITELEWSEYQHMCALSLLHDQGGAVYGTGEPSAQTEAQEAFFQPLSGGNDALDDFGAEDRRSAPVFGYR